jgi:creatinine amidohydrolase
MSYSLDEIPWSDAQRALTENPRLILPIGALDQHGPHLPLGTNIVIAQRVAREVSQALGILCAPTFSYGVTADGGPFPGRAGLRRKTLHRAINELIGRWEDHGIEDFVIITAHRYEPHLEALLMTASGPSTKSVYDLYQIDASDIVDSDPEIEHAGELETSLMLHLTPELVHMSRAVDFLPEGGTLRKYTRRRLPTPPVSSQGVLGSPTRASAEKGAIVFDRYVSLLCGAISRL